MKDPRNLLIGALLVVAAGRSPFVAPGGRREELLTKMREFCSWSDILAAAKELGFEKYEPALAAALESFKSDAKDKRETKKSKKQKQATGMTQEELIEMQNKLFAQAAQKAAGGE